MKLLKAILLFLLHTAATATAQLCLYHMALKSTETSSGVTVGAVLLAVGICIADLVLTSLLLKGRDFSRIPALILQFWDLLLLCPLFVMGLFSLFSGGKGTAFGAAVLLLDLLLILERSTSFVLSDPGRKGNKSS